MLEGITRDAIIRIARDKGIEVVEQGFTRDDYTMPADVHKEYSQIEGEHFNSASFHDELRTKVCDRFDQMLADEGL